MTYAATFCSIANGLKRGPDNMNALEYIQATVEPQVHSVLTGLKHLAAAGVLEDYTVTRFTRSLNQPDPLHGCAPFEFKFGGRECEQKNELCAGMSALVYGAATAIWPVLRILSWKTSRRL